MITSQGLYSHTSQMVTLHSVHLHVCPLCISLFINLFARLEFRGLLLACPRVFISSSPPLSPRSNFSTVPQALCGSFPPKSAFCHSSSRVLFALPLITSTAVPSLLLCCTRSPLYQAKVLSFGASLPVAFFPLFAGWTSDHFLKQPKERTKTCPVLLR